MASIQDIDSRVRVIEDKVDFMMKSFSFQQKSAVAGPNGQEIVAIKTLLDLYHDLKASGADQLNASDLNDGVKIDG